MATNQEFGHGLGLCALCGSDLAGSNQWAICLECVARQFAAQQQQAQALGAQQALGVGQLGGIGQQQAQACFQQHAMAQPGQLRYADFIAPPPSGFDQEAEMKARTLLLSLLTPEQREAYETTRYFHITRDGKQYKLGDNLQVHVRDLKKNTIENWCAFVANTPRCDTLIAQLLILRDSPDKLRSMANVTKISFEQWDNQVERVTNRQMRMSRIGNILRRAGYFVPMRAPSEE